MNDFDKTARLASKQLDPAAFLRWLLGDPGPDWRWTGWLDAQAISYPGEPDRRADTVAVFERDDGPPVAAVIEFESRPRGGLLERLAEYTLRVRRELLSQRDPKIEFSVIGALVNLTGPARPAAWEMRPPGFGGLGLQFQARVRTLREEDASALLAAIEASVYSAALLPWIPLMRGGDDPALLARWKALASAEKDERRRADYAVLARPFADLAGRGPLWRQALEGWNVERSEYFMEIEALGEAKGEAKGEARGLAKGVAIGEAQGISKALGLLRERLLRLVEKRFNQPPAEDLIAVVNAQTELAVLHRWYDDAWSASTLADLRRAVGLP
jgi:hypothetical protein